MGNSIKLNGIQKLIAKAVGIPLSGIMTPSRFQEVVMRTFGIVALWQNDGYEYNVKAYSDNSTLYAIIKRITDMAAVAPFKVYRIKQGKKSLHLQIKAWTGEFATETSIMKAMRLKSLVYEEDNNHPLNALIDRPNINQLSHEFVSNSVGFKCLTGNRFLYAPLLDAGADRGLPSEVYNLPPQHMIIVPDGTPYGVDSYRFKLDRNQERIEVNSIIHSKYFNPDFCADGAHLWGLSPVRAGRKNLTRSDAALERSVATLQNAGSAGALFNKDGSQESEEQARATKDAINRRINGKDNSGSISYLNGDFGYLNFGMTANDMQVLQAEKYSDQKLCNIYSFPPGALDPDKATYANSKEFNKQIITGAVIPELSSLRDDWNQVAKLYKDDIYVDYDLSVYPELQEDLEKMAGALEKIWYLTGNEKRLMIGQDEDSNPMMSKYLIPGGLVPLDSLDVSDTELINGLAG